MKLSQSFITILQSRDYFVEAISHDCEFWGTTYNISHFQKDRKPFKLVVESGNSMEEFIENLERKKSELENDYFDSDEKGIQDYIVSLSEIICLAEKWHEIKNNA